MALVAAVVGYHDSRSLAIVAVAYLFVFNPIMLWAYVLIWALIGEYSLLIWKVLMAIPGVLRLRDRIKDWIHERTAP
jgi:hypothetical protein